MCNFLCQNVLIYYLQKLLKHFGLEILLKWGISVQKKL